VLAVFGRKTSFDRVGRFRGKKIMLNHLLRRLVPSLADAVMVVLKMPARFEGLPRYET
jgi:hypothetical protein